MGCPWRTVAQEIAPTRELVPAPADTGNRVSKDFQCDSSDTLPGDDKQHLGLFVVKTSDFAALDRQ